MTSLMGGAVVIKPLLLTVIALFLLWHLVWRVLGVRPRFPWQLKARLGAGASDLVLLAARTTWNLTCSTCPEPKTSPIC